MLVESATENDDAVFYKWSWGKRNHETVRGFSPYFFVPITEDDPPMATRVERGPWVGIDGVRLKKVVCDHPRDVPKVREGYTHYSADVPFHWRFMSDLGDMPKETRPRVNNLDIEVKSDGKRFTQPTAATEPILCIDNNVLDHHWQFGWHPGWDKDQIKMETGNEEVGFTKTTVYTFNTEVDMMEAYLRFWPKLWPEVVAGWNVVGYDETYLITRLRKIGLDARRLSPIRRIDEHTNKETGRITRTIAGRIAFDLDRAYKAYMARVFDGNRLIDVVKRELGPQEDKSIDAANTEAVWRNDPVKLLQYNWQDCDWLRRLDNKLGLVDTFVEIHHATGAPLKDCTNLGTALEFYLSRYWKPKNLVIPSKQRKIPFTGADVMAPVRGVHEWVAGVDIVGAYPAGILTFNIGINSHRTEGDNLINLGIGAGKNGRDIPGLTFCQHDEEESHLLAPLQGMLDFKDHYNKEKKKHEYGSVGYHVAERRRYTYKRLANTTMGIAGQEGRLFHQSVAWGITSGVGHTIRYSRKVAQELGYPPVGSHTDALYFKTGAKDLDGAKEVGQMVCDAVNEGIHDFVASMGVADLKRNTLAFEFDTVARRALLLNKTYYSMELVWKGGKDLMEKPDVEIKGFGAVRSDNNKVARNVQRKVLNMLMTGRDKDAVLEVIRQEREAVLAGKYGIRDLGIPKGIKKSLIGYPQGRPEIRGMKWSNQHLGKDYGQGSKPLMLYTKGRTNVVCIDPDDLLPEGVMLDLHKLAKKSIDKKVQPILDAAGFIARQSVLEGLA